MVFCAGRKQNLTARPQPCVASVLFQSLSVAMLGLLFQYSPCNQGKSWFEQVEGWGAKTSGLWAQKLGLLQLKASTVKDTLSALKTEIEFCLSHQFITHLLRGVNSARFTKLAVDRLPYPFTQLLATLPTLFAITSSVCCPGCGLVDFYRASGRRGHLTLPP